MKFSCHSKCLVVVITVWLVSCFNPSSPVSEHPAIDSIYQKAVARGGSLSVDSLILWAHQIDSLSTDFANGHNKAILLSGWYYLNKFKMDTGYYLVKKANLYFKKHDSLSYESGFVSVLLGTYHLRKFAFDSSEFHNRIALAIYQEINHKKGLAGTLQTFGDLYYLNDKWPEALEYYTQAFELKTEIEATPNSIATLLSQITSIYIWLGQYEEALLNGHKALSMLEPQSPKLISVYNGLASAHKATQSFDSSLYYYHQSIDVGKTVGMLGMNNSAEFGLATVYGYQKRYEESNKICLRLIENGSRHWGLVPVYNQLASNYNYLGKEDSALFFGRKAFEGAIIGHDFTIAADVSNLLYNLYNRKRMDSTLYYLKAHLQFKDSLYNQESQKKLSTYYAQIKTMQKQNEIDDLEIQNELQEQEARQMLIIMIAGSIVAVLIIMVLMLTQKYLKKKAQLRHNELQLELEKRNEELNMQAARMISMSNGVREIEDNLKKLQKESAGNYNDVQQVLNSIKINQMMEREWANFDEYFGVVHAEFYSKLDSLANSFTLTEKRLAGLIRMNMNNSEIASILNIENNSVKMAKYRLKKKLELSEDQNMSNYLSSL